MILLNLSHPLPPAQLRQIEALSGMKIQRVLDLPVHFNAELHGRMGYSPCLRLRPVEGSLPPRFEMVEILNLQEIREIARANR
ncbi:MAG: hypothetical protein HUU32_16950 [Calditrichaceae bacterium]|nr:CRISPR-associated protein Csx15 [Calditrichia bacterium]NUQ43080.1 hypothetical protein [Calditrichaceae bacterium]